MTATIFLSDGFTIIELALHHHKVIRPERGNITGGFGSDRLELDAARYDVANCPKEALRSVLLLGLTAEVVSGRHLLIGRQAERILGRRRRVAA